MNSRSKQPPVFIIGLPSTSDFYNKIIKILNTLTGTTWGFMRAGTKILYLTAAEFPIKIGVKYGAPPKNSKMDILIDAKYPSKYQSIEHWIAAATAELQAKLLAITNKTGIGAEFYPKIATWSDESYENMIDEAVEQNKKYTDVNKNYYNAFNLSCASAGFG